MSDLDAHVNAIRERVAVAQRARARAEHELDAATAKAAAVAEALQRDFGVTTIDDAKAVLAELDQALTDEVAVIQAVLDDIGV